MPEYNNPVMCVDISGESPVLAIGILFGFTLVEVLVIVVVAIVLAVVILEIANDFYYTKKLLNYVNNNSNSSSLPYRGDVSIPARLNDDDGNVKQKRWYGEDGLPIRDRDYNHPGNMDFPHDHDWVDGKRIKEHQNVDYDKYPEDKNGDEED